MEFFTLTFLRHGESLGNAQGYYQGQKDYPLTTRGKSQVKRLISRWQADGTSFDQVIASPLIRARDTAQQICDAFGCPMTEDEDWQERDIGVLSGVRREEADKVYPRPNFFTPYEAMGVTGEGDWALYLRAGRALHKILKRPPARYLIVSHGGILNQVMHVVFGMTPQASGQGVHFRFVNTAFSKVYYDPGKHKWVVWGLNDFTHLAVRDFDLEEEEES
jgi:2,3-bisphosphoglycerate-dependent phosphoglycerate mutase